MDIHFCFTIDQSNIGLIGFICLALLVVIPGLEPGIKDFCRRDRWYAWRHPELIRKEEEA